MTKPNGDPKTSRAGRIRAWLAEQPGEHAPGGLSVDRLTGDIAEGIGAPGDIKVAFTIAVMYHGGWLGRLLQPKTTVGERARWRYFLTDRPVIARQQPDERRRRKNEREARRRRQKAVMPLDAYRKMLENDRALKAAETKKRQEAKRKARAAALAVLEDKRHDKARPVMHKPKPVPKPTRVLRAVPDGPSRPAPAAKPAMTVDEFLAEGGKVDVLTPCTWSKPLRSATGT